jgi:hypothetical protein
VTLHFLTEFADFLSGTLMCGLQEILLSHSLQIIPR